MENKKHNPVHVGESPDFDAWFTAFFLKNSIDPFAYPTKVGSKEQIEFMVYLENGERYFPCSDKMFDAIMSRKYPPFLKKPYKQVFDRIMAMIDELIDSEYDNRFLKALIKIKYDDEIRTGLLIPSRLEKKLHKIFLSRTHIENPYSEDKKSANKRITTILSSETVEKVYHHRDGQLVLEDERFEISNDWWQSEEVVKTIRPRVEKIAEDGGYVLGAFDERRIVGICALDHKFFSKKRLNVDIIFVNRGYRGKGIGTHLMEMLKEEAQNREARHLYVSATPSENTVDFYLGLGFKVSKKVEPELFEKEPEDIHMELKL